MIRPLHLFALSALSLQAVDSVVTLNEIHYNPSGTGGTSEWIELHNQMAINVDLSGWQITDGVSFTIPSGTTIPGGGYLILANDPSDPALAGTDVVGPFTGSLSNSGEKIELRNKSNRLMDEVEYGDSGQWPFGPDGSGATLAKLTPNLLSSKSASWRASSQLGGTPGARNFPEPGLPIPHIFIANDATWNFNDSGTAPAATWNTSSFNDASWSNGQSLFGTGTAGPANLTVTDHLVERFRAADITGASNGQTLTTWPDTATDDGQTQSATAGGNPTFATNATPSGEPAVRFDGNDEFRTSTSPGIPGNSGFVYFAVVKANSPPGSGGVSNGAGPYIWDRDPSVSDPPLTSLKSDSGRFGFQKRYDNNTGLGGPVSTSPISTTSFQIVALRRNTTSNRFELWVDGTLETTEGDSGATLTPQPIVIGSHATNINAGFNGDIAELLIYEDELTDAEFQAVGAYLESRYGLDTAFPGSAVTTALSETAGTTYFRQNFTFTGTPANTSVRLNHQLADGAAFYLNGIEVARTNLPAGALSHTTDALSNISSPASSGFLTIPSASLLNGPNVLAVSLHTAAGDNNTSFSATLEATETPADLTTLTSLTLHEISPAGDPGFFIEFTNPGTSPIDTTGYTLTITGSSPTTITLPSTTLNPGNLLLLTQTELGVIPASNDKVFLYPPSGASLADGREITNRLRGLSTAYPGQWIFPNSATPGTPNSFSLQHDIVINEICYNPPILNADPGLLPTTESVSLIGPGTIWRFNQTGPSLPSDWATQAHPVGAGWQSGPSVIAYDTDLGLPIATTLANPTTQFPSLVTYYFETDFTLTAGQAADLGSLTLNHLIDDGAVIYLNGVEIDRYNIAAGTVTSATFANPPGIDNATYSGQYDVPIPPGTALTGTNRISVEVHQVTFSSSDVVFDLQADALLVTAPGTPPSPARPSDDQWIELYNRGDQALDLSNWSFGEGIGYTFPANTTLAAGAYLILSNNPAKLAQAQPGITILGPFSGSLSRSGETLTLVDSFNNPADTLRYIDGGQWPSKADAGGSTLELRDPTADNALPGAWAPSDELSRTSWQTYTYRGTAASSAVGNDNQWREFVFGLLEEGEILIDDLTVTENPDGSAVPFITNSTFDNLNNWRALGTHQFATIIPDPDGGGNNVLHLKATGSTEHMHNHLETTLRNNEAVVNGQEYEISFRARWLGGNHLLHTRLYFNRLPFTTHLERPEILGTPGQPNSTLVANAGPTSRDLSHSPVVPAPGEPVTISVNLSDPDDLGTVNLHYRVEGGAFSTVTMSQIGASPVWQGTIPGQSRGNVVQFYLTAADTLGASSFVPADGPDSRAMFEVEDGRAATTGCINNIRIIMDPTDQIWMHTPRNVMSNHRIPCTIIDRESTIHYDAGVRIKGSERARTQVNRIGFNISFPKDNLFRQVHRTIALDRSEGQVVGQRELLFDLMATSSGGVTGEHNDLAYVISPDPSHTSAAILQLARYGSNYLDDQYDNGADGTVYEYELIYYPTSTDAGGYKIPEPDSVVGRDINNIGDNPEDYRWTYLIKNNQELNDLQPAMTLGKQFSKSTTDFNASVADVLDVDQWLRALAYSCATGAGDSFYTNSNHNGQFYGRPDGKILYFPHDMDFSFNATRSITENSELNRIIANQGYRRSYLSHLYDICSTVYNQAWMAPWTTHFDECVPGGNVFSDDLGYINTRSNYILGQVNSQVGSVGFAITTNNGNDFSTDDTPVTLTGTGWLDVHEIRLATSGNTLPITWTDTSHWSLAVALSPGANPVTLDAYDRDGTLLGSDSITITHTGTSTLPNASNLVFSEIYYNPPGQDEETEYLELMNIGPVELDLSLTYFSSGLTFTFPVGTTLAPGQRLVILRNQTAFEAQFGAQLNIGGTFTGSLDNGGELIALNSGDGVPILSFTYDDDAPWPVEADGDGYSLVLVVPECAPDHNLAINWQASLNPGGSPGTSGILTLADWKATYGNPADDSDPDNDGWTVLEEFFLGGSPVTRDNLAPVFTYNLATLTATATVTRRAGIPAKLNLETSSNLGNWATHPGANIISNQRPQATPDVETLTFSIPLSQSKEFFRFTFTP
ncbi:MAG: lamin tail domain-containing protein [Akkermansiaceae bacterium]